MQPEYSQELGSLIEAGDLAGVAKFLREDVQLLQADTPYGSWLDMAAYKGQFEIVRLLVSLGSDVNGVNSNNTRPICEAARGGNVDVVTFLLNNGATTNLYDRDPLSNPLFAAISRKSVEIVRILLAHGIDASVDYGNGKTAASFAFLSGARDIADVIAEHLSPGDPAAKAATLGADRDAANRQGERKRVRILPTPEDLER